MDPLRWFPALHSDEIALLRRGVGRQTLRGVDVETSLAVGVSELRQGELLVSADETGPALVVKRLREAPLAAVVFSPGVSGAGAVPPQASSLSAFVEAIVDLLYVPEASAGSGMGAVPSDAVSANMVHGPLAQPFPEAGSADTPAPTRGAGGGNTVAASGSTRSPPPGLSLAPQGADAGESSAEPSGLASDGRSGSGQSAVDNDIDFPPSPFPMPVRANSVLVPLVAGEPVYTTAMRAVALAFPQAMMLRSAGSGAGSVGAGGAGSGGWSFDLTTPFGWSIQVEIEGQETGEESSDDADGGEGRPIAPSVAIVPHRGARRPAHRATAGGAALAWKDANPFKPLSKLLPSLLGDRMPPQSRLWVTAGVAPLRLVGSRNPRLLSLGPAGQLPGSITDSSDEEVPSAPSGHQQNPSTPTNAIAAAASLAVASGAYWGDAASSEGFSKQQQQQQQQQQRSLRASAPDFDPDAFLQPQPQDLHAYQHQNQQPSSPHLGGAGASHGAGAAATSPPSPNGASSEIPSFLTALREIVPPSASIAANNGFTSSPEFELAGIMRDTLTEVCSLLATAAAAVNANNACPDNSPLPFPFNVMGPEASQMMRLSGVQCVTLPLPPMHDGSRQSTPASVSSAGSSAGNTPPSADGGRARANTDAGAASALRSNVIGHGSSPHARSRDFHNRLMLAEDEGFGALVGDVLSKLDSSGASQGSQEEGTGTGTGTGSGAQGQAAAAGAIDNPNPLNVSGIAVEPYTLFLPEHGAQSATSALDSESRSAPSSTAFPSAAEAYGMLSVSTAGRSATGGLLSSGPAVAATAGAPAVPATPHSAPGSVHTGSAGSRPRPGSPFSTMACKVFAQLYRDLLASVTALNECLAVLKRNTFHDKNMKANSNAPHEPSIMGRPTVPLSASAAAVGRFGLASMRNSIADRAQGAVHVTNPSVETTAGIKMRYTAVRRAYLDAGVVPLCLIGVEIMPHLPMPFTGLLDQAAEVNHQMGCSLELLIQCLTNIAFDVAVQRQITAQPSVSRPLFAILLGKLKACLTLDNGSGGGNRETLASPILPHSEVSNDPGFPSNATIINSTTGSSSSSSSLGVVNAAEICIKVCRFLWTMCHDNNQLAAKTIIELNGIELAGLGLVRHFEHGEGFAALKYLELLASLYKLNAAVAPGTASIKAVEGPVTAVLRGALDANINAGIDKCYAFCDNPSNSHSNHSSHGRDNHDGTPSGKGAASVVTLQKIRALADSLSSVHRSAIARLDESANPNTLAMAEPGFRGGAAPGGGGAAGVDYHPFKGRADGPGSNFTTPGSAPAGFGRADARLDSYGAGSAGGMPAPGPGMMAAGGGGRFPQQLAAGPSPGGYGGGSPGGFPQPQPQYVRPQFMPQQQQYGGAGVGMGMGGAGAMPQGYPHPLYQQQPQQQFQLPIGGMVAPSPAAPVMMMGMMGGAYLVQQPQPQQHQSPQYGQRYPGPAGPGGRGPSGYY